MSNPDFGSRRYKAGDTIAGIYRVLDVFEGGLGLVYVVEHTSGDRIVLKTLKDASVQATNFRREAEMWVRLGSHANIVKALYVDEIAGMLCVAAELIEPDEIGRLTLRDYLQLGALTPTQIARFTAHFCYGLEHARRRGLLSHRDIKPENLLIGSSDILKITDFGIAKAVPFADDSQSKRLKLGRWRTAGREVSGTPPYMAPEQILGSQQQDERVDIYAFGVVLYEMAYGRLPFVAGTAEEIFHLHLHTRPAVPDGVFAKLIDRCLMKAPDDRYYSVAKLFHDLKLICGARKIALPTRPEPTDAIFEELRARALSFGALGRTEEAIESTRQLIKQSPRDASSWTQLGRLLSEHGDNRRSKEATNRALALDPSRSAAWNNLGLLLKREGKWLEAIEALDRALDCDPQNTGAMLNAAEPLSKVGRAIEGIHRLRRATEIAPDVFSIWTNLAGLYVHLGERSYALECYQRARELCSQKYQSEIDESIRIAEQLPDSSSEATHMAHGSILEAKEKLRQTVKHAPDDKGAWHNLGICHMADQEFSDARDCFGQVHRIDGTDDFAVCRLIELAAMTGDLPDAEKYCDLLESLPDGQIASIAFRARALAECDRYQKAKAFILNAVRKYPNEPDILIACGDIMMVYPTVGMAMGNAVTSYQRAVEILKLNGNDIKRQREIENRLREAQENLAACTANE